jgi:hypothetical protein
MTIPKPRRPRDHPDRFADCRLAIEDKLIELIGEASDAGWHRDEILSAIAEITDNLSMARREDVAIKIKMQLAKLMKKKIDE